MKAIIRLEVPEHQIGREVSCYFKDTMSVKGICEKAEESEWEHDHDVLKAYDNGFEDGLDEGLKVGACEDCISRQAAIDLADELKDDLPDDDRLSDMVMSHNEGILEYQTKLSLLPSVTPKQKTGRWIDDKCSVCGKGIEDLIASPEWYSDEKPNFCPFCGIKIEEDDYDKYEF